MCFNLSTRGHVEHMHSLVCASYVCMFYIEYKHTNIFIYTYTLMNRNHKVWDLIPSLGPGGPATSPTLIRIPNGLPGSGLKAQHFRQTPAARSPFINSPNSEQRKKKHVSNGHCGCFASATSRNGAHGERRGRTSPDPALRLGSSPFVLLTLTVPLFCYTLPKNTVR